MDRSGQEEPGQIRKLSASGPKWPTGETAPDKQEDCPAWLSKQKTIKEGIFCDWFLSVYPMKCINGRFYSKDGIVEDEGFLKKLIYDELSIWLDSGVGRRTEDLLKALRIASFSEPVPPDLHRIHVANGTLCLDGTFTEEKVHCMNRLTVDYRPDSPTPSRWLSFLSELLEEEDIPALQEYLGYCLLPVTRAQKMMMLIGRGGEGKSRIQCVMSAIFGDSMNTTSIQKVETNRFSRADLEGKLLMIDDDMDICGLPKTNLIKSIITCEGKMDTEKKGIQSVQRRLYVRFLCFGNGALTALHDRSDGFFRRQIILTTKDRPEDRVDDPFLSEKLISEKEGIFLWMVEGLKRLMANDYRFSISRRALDNLASVSRDADNIRGFMESEGYFTFQEDGAARTRDLYEAYREWCDDNADQPLSMKSFSNHFAMNYRRYGLTPTNNIYSAGRRGRGYTGIRTAV